MKNYKETIIIMAIILGFMVGVVWGVSLFTQNTAGSSLGKSVLEEATLISSDKDSVIYSVDVTETSTVYFNYNYFQNVHVYYHDDNGMPVSIGFCKERYIFKHFDLTSEAVKNGVIYFEVSSYIKKFGVFFIEHQAFTQLSNRLMIYHVFSLGIIFAMIIANFVLSVLMKTRNFVIHGTFLLFIFLYVFSSSGISCVLLGDQGAGYISYSLFADFFLMLFIYSYLRIHHHGRYGKYFMWFIMLSVFLLGATALIAPNRQIYYSAVGIGILTPFVMLGYLLRYGKYKQSNIIYITVGLLFVGVSTMYMGLSYIGYYPVSIWTKVSFNFSVALEALFFTLGLLDYVSYLKRKNQEYYENSIIDALTQTKNRHYFDIVKDQLIEESERYNYPLSFILMDIDNFKQVNDTYGHDTGDQVLIQLSKIVQRAIRSSDIFIRWGGEEFFVILPHSTLNDAVALAEKLRLTVIHAAFQGVGNISISLGVASYEQREPLQAFYRRIDGALYEAKKSGRNQVAFSEKAFSKKPLSTMEWQARFESGNKVIDDEHKSLLMHSKELEGMEDSIVLMHGIQSLISEVETHFADEERILEASGYTDLEAHQKIHRELVENISDLYTQVQEGDLSVMRLLNEIIRTVVVGHLIAEDVKFFKLFNEMDEN